MSTPVNTMTTPELRKFREEIEAADNLNTIRTTANTRALILRGIEAELDLRQHGSTQELLETIQELKDEVNA